jgi:nucleoside-triphosphatase THEP1
MLVVKNSRLDMIEGLTLDLLEETKELVDADVEAEKEAEREAGLRANPTRQSITYTELSVMPIIGPSGSTKTTSMVAIAEKLKKQNPGKTPILVVKLRSSTTRLKHLHVQILEAFNDPQAETVRNQIVTHSDNVTADAIRNVARAAGTYIVVLDEAHSVIGVRDKWAKAQAFAPHIKSLVNDGLFAVIVMGTEDANFFFETSPELNNRKFDSISLNPVDLSNPDDFRYFYKLIGRIDRELVAQDILDEPIGLVDDLKSRALLYDMSGGVVGVISRILMIALRTVQRKGRRTIDWDKDIKPAFWAWKAEQKDENGDPIKVYDPFVEKIRPTTSDAVASMSKTLGI